MGHMAGSGRLLFIIVQCLDLLLKPKKKKVQHHSRAIETKQ
jgi:hypothetical protein